jgi:hypothetical protein
MFFVVVGRAQAQRAPQKPRACCPLLARPLIIAAGAAGAAWEKECEYSLEHGEDEVAVMTSTAEDNCSWLHGSSGTNLDGIRLMAQVSMGAPGKEQKPPNEHLMGELGAGGARLSRVIWSLI